MKRTKSLSVRDVRLLSCIILAFCLSIIMTACANTKSVATDCKQDSRWMLADSALSKYLADSISLTLFCPDTVKCYHIIYKDTIREKDIQVVKGYVRNTLLTTLNEGQTAILQYLLLSNPTCYSKDTVLVQSPYLPSLEFEFQKQGKPTISVIVSNIDKSWQMLVNREQVSSYNFVDSRPIERFCNYFINLYLRKEDIQ